MIPIEARALRRLIANIEKDLNKLHQLKAEKDELDIETAHPRIIGSILHDLYTGMESIFEKIAKELEGGVTKSPDWHRDLLEDMALRIRNLRPPVIDDTLRKELDEYLRFRHPFRSLYGFELECSRMQPLIERFDDVLAKFEHQIHTFLQAVEKIAAGMEDDSE